MRKFMLQISLSSFWLILSCAGVSFAALNPATVLISTGSANFAWNPETANYTAVLSTVATFEPYISSGTLTDNSTSYSDLDPNTIYYFKVKNTADSAYASPISTITYAAKPSNPIFISNYFTAISSYNASVNIAWDTNGNPDITEYTVEVSTGSSFPNSNEGNLYLSQFLPPVDIATLNANTTYFFRVKAQNFDGIPTAYTSTVSTGTLAIDTPLAETLVYETSATIKWTPVQSGNQAEDSEGYSILLSTSVIYNPVLESWSTSNDSISEKTFESLDRNTTHYFKLGALNWGESANYNNFENFTTLTKKPQNLSIVSVASNTLSLGWSAFPSAPSADSAGGYIIEASSTNFNSGQTISSATYALAQSTLTLSGLKANTTYYLRMGAFNKANIPNYTQVLSTVTLTLSLSKALAATSVSSITVRADFMPLDISPQEYTCEGYVFQASTAAFGAGGVIYSSSTDVSAVNSLAIDNLWPSTTYYIRLGSLNWGKAAAYTDLDPIITNLPPPLPAITFKNIWQSSATVLFSSIDCDGYAVQASTYQYFNYIAAENSTTNDAVSELLIEGISENTEYYFRAGPIFNGATSYTLTTPKEISTLPLPVSPALTNVFYSSITLNWTPLASAPSTSTAEGYVFETSVYSDFQTILYSSQTSLISADRLTIENLLPNTTYYSRVGTINWDGAKNYVQAPTTATLANTPIQENFSGLTTGEMTINWDENLNPNDTLYILELSSNSDFSAPVFSSSTKNNFAEFTNLIPNTTYYPRMSVYNRFNIQENQTLFSSMATLSFNPIFGTYGNLGVSSITLNWGKGSNPDGTFYIAEISSSAFNPPIISSVTQSVSAVFTELIPNASYQMRVSAYNHSNIPTPSTSLGTALTYPTTPYAVASAETFSDFMIDGLTVNWLSNGNSSFTIYNIEISTKDDFSVLAASGSTLGMNMQFTGLLTNTTYWSRMRAEGLTQIRSSFVNIGSTMTLGDVKGNIIYNADSTVTLDTSYGDIFVFAPIGSFGGSTIMTVEPETSFAAPVSAVSTLKETGIGINITYSPKSLILKPISITIAYKLAEMPGGINRNNLVIAAYDDAHNVWTPLPSVSDTINNTVTAQTWHLSTFQLMEISPGGSLKNVKIYPNPYQPSSITDVMHFANLPPYSKIQIYTLLGEFVKKIKADKDGTAYWEGLNKSKRKVASGVYIVLIQSPDGKKKMLKVAIER